MTLQKDSLLRNRYRILEILGEGGMGAVYKVRDENLGVLVAVKENLFTTEEYARQFRMEATILASLRHPNLTRVTDHFEEGDGQYLVMDFIEGEDLRDRMDRVGILDEEEIITIGRAICEALTYLHTRIPTILHRDIKPGNVRIAPNGQVFLVDFGLAKIVEGSQLTMTGARAMTPGYSPPEQYGTARTDARSDIYSLGATLYSAITGSLPEDGLARAMNQVTLTPVRKLNPKVSRKLSNVIEKALSVHPDERYQNAEDFQKALTNARGVSRKRQSQEPLTVAPPPSAILDDVLTFNIPEAASKPLAPQIEIPSVRLPPPQLVSPADIKPSFHLGRPSLPVSKPITRPDSDPVFEVSQKSDPKKKKTLGCVPLLLLIFLLVGGSALAAYLLYPREFNDALAFFVQPSVPSPTADNTALAPTEIPATAPVETPIVAVASPTSLAPTATPTLPLPTPTVTPRPSTATPAATATNTLLPGPTPFGGSGQLVFASDGAGNPQLFIINADGTDLHQLTNIPEGACQPDWSVNDQIIFISPCTEERDDYPGANLWLINPDGTDLEQLTFDALGNYDPKWSPDGAQIVYTSVRSGYPQIHLLTLADGTDQQLTDRASQGFRNVQPSFSPDGSQITFISARDGPIQVWIMNVDGSDQTRFSRSGDLKDVWPVFSGDGQALIFTQRQLNGGIPRIVVAPLADDGNTEIILIDNLIPRRAAVVSPDGQWLAFESWPAGNNHEIFLMTPTGEQLTQLTNTDAAIFDFDPAWRPIP
ncbi:MAG: serine/threonine-protein kinase [Anaerolineales bacterium]|nr:serine/threonine-protein kinase [Anaerolineales bacterium]